MRNSKLTTLYKIFNFIIIANLAQTYWRLLTVLFLIFREFFIFNIISPFALKNFTILVRADKCTEPSLVVAVRWDATLYECYLDKSGSNLARKDCLFTCICGCERCDKLVIDVSAQKMNSNKLCEVAIMEYY